MKKKIVAALLLTVMCVSLVLTGCSQTIMTAGGEKMKAGYYSFYVHWQRDYYKELLKGYGYNITEAIDNYFTETATVRQTIVDTAKSQYLSFVVVSKKFEELGLSLTEEELAEIDKQYNDEWLKIYGENGMKNILKTLDLKKDEFMNLLTVEYKSNAILEYYYGENGVNAITKQDKKDYFHNNYYRFKYILFTTVDDNEKPLSADEIGQKRTLAEDLCKQAQNGAKFEDLLIAHSEDYVKITDDMSDEDKKSAEDANKESITTGMICDSNGIFNQTLYSLYDIAVHDKIVGRVKEMSIGDVTTVEIDNSVWVIQKCDIKEDEAYFTDREARIYKDMYSDDFNNKYTVWLAELDYKFDENTLKELDPGNFTDLFSEVYDMEDENSSTGTK